MKMASLPHGRSTVYQQKNGSLLKPCGKTIKTSIPNKGYSRTLIDLSELIEFARHISFPVTDVPSPPKQMVRNRSDSIKSYSLGQLEDTVLTSNG